MTRQEELREQYEDALFTLLMEEVAVAEGEEFLRESEALRGDPEAAVPEEVIRRCRRTINRCFSRQRRRSLARQFRWVFQKASVVALLGVLLFSAVYAISPEFRVGVLNLVVETLDESTDVSFMDNPTNENGTSHVEMRVNWVPDIYQLYDEGYTDTTAWMYFEANGDSLKIDLIAGQGQITSLDAEDTSTISVTINGIPGIISNKDGLMSLTIVDFDKSLNITIRSTNITTEEIIKIAENIQY